MKPTSNPLLRASRLALVAITFGALPSFAGTTWDGGGADTNLGTGANWNVDDVAPAFDGTASVTFSTAGTTATVAPAGNIDFNSITLNQASGFTIQSGAGTLRVKGTTTSSTSNGCINASGTNAMTISAPVVVSTVGSIFNVNNSNSAATGLTLSGGLSASSSTYSFRLGGSGKTVISGTVTGVNGIQQNSGNTFSGTVVFDCNLAAAGSLSIPSTTSGAVSAPKIQMGTSTSQTQSWTTSSIVQNSTIIVNSTATMTALAIGNAGSNGSSGATVEVGGSLSGTTLTVGGGVYTGNLKVSGTASFSGDLVTGSQAGSKIVGNAPTPGTLKLSSGTNLNGSTSTVIGGAGTNENNLNLEKINAGTLTLTGTNPYTGSTTVTAGILDIGGATLSGTSALTVGASGTLGLAVSTPSTIPGTATFTAGSKVKLTGTATDGAVIMTATLGMSGTAPTLNPAVPGFITEISGNQLKLKAAVVPTPLNTWDAGGANTNIDTAANWGQDTLPASSATVTFGDAGSTATVNVDSQFAAVVLNRNAAFNIAGPNNLILSSVNSSSSTNLSVTTAGGTQTIDAPLQVDTTNTANKFLSLANNSTTQTLDINGSISRTSGSTADYALRFQNTAGSTTRIDGALNNLSGIQQAFSGTVAGDLVFGGNRTSTVPISIGASPGTGVAPATTARLFLGETPTDTQTWGNLTLNNTIKLVVGGNVTAGTIAVGGNATAANTRIVGNSATNSTLSLTGGTINNLVTLGGAGTNENKLSLVMAGPNTLTISGGTHTYTGPTTVNGGTLNLASGVTLPSSITVNAGTTLTGEGTTTGTLAFGSGSTSLTFDPTTSPASFTANSVDLTTAGTIYVSPSVVTTSGTHVVLTRSTGSFSPADLAKFVLASRGGTLSITGGSNNEISLNAAVSTPASLVWKGNAANPSYWDSAITQNWANGINPDRFYPGDDVTFNDTATTYVVDVQGASVAPGNVVFNNTTAYTVNGGGILSTGSFSKSGNGLLTLANSSANTFSSGLDVTGGILAFSAVNQLGGTAVAIDLDGATLRFIGAGSSVSDSLALTLGAAGGTIDCTTLNTTFRLGGKISGTGNLLKTGAGILALGKGSNTDPLNDFSGTLTVTGGAVDIRHANSLGESDADSGTSIQTATLLMQNFGQTTGSTIEVAEHLAFTGTSNWSVFNQENKAFTDRFTGPVSVSGTLNISSAITSGAQVPVFEINGPVTTNPASTLALGVQGGYPLATVATAQNIVVGGAITGSGAVTAQGDAGSVYTLSAPGYSGNTTVNSGTLKLGAVNANNEASTVTIESGAKIDIAFSGNDTVAALVLGGTNVPAGTYNSSHPTYGSYFLATNTGSIVVASASGYSAWQTANGAGSQTVDQDHDNDGVDNGVEYFLGGNTNTTGFTPLPGVVANSVTWVKSSTYTGAFNTGTGFKVQSSTNLTTWTDASAGTGAGQVNIVGNNVTYNLPTGAGKTFVRLLVNPN